MLRLLLLPFSWLYGSLVSLRNSCYDARLLGAERIGVPVISVGNLTAGGTGKTPFVEYLVQYFLEKGKKVAVLSRGYKRTGSGPVVVSDGDGVKASPDRSGDEPFQIARKFSGAVVMADERRTRSARVAVDRFHADVILLDDGFQHRAIGRDLDIVMIDGGESLARMPMLPAGLRREPLSSLRRAGLLVISRPSGRASAENDMRRYSPAREVSVRFKPDCVSHAFRAEALSPESIRGRSAFALCGIANPARFEQMLKEMGLDIRGSLTFPDHHRFSAADLRRIRDQFERSDAAMILTTEKDAIRLSTPPAEPVLETLPVYFVRIRADIVEGKSILHSLLDSVMERAVR